MKKLLAIIISFCMFFGFSSCNDEEPENIQVEQTLFMYFPWSTNLTFSLDKNVADMQAAFAEYGTDKQRIIVFFAESSNTAKLFELVKAGDSYERNMLKTYTFANSEYTTVNGLSNIIADMKYFSPSEKYSMLIGCHGLGWIDTNSFRFNNAYNKMKMHWEGKLLTRYFGELTNDCITNLTTLRQAIENNALKFDYILFDNCYMANVEVAYELRNTTDYIIASTSEILSMGLPYQKIGRYLMGSYDFKAVCDGVFEYYANSSQPYVTLSLIDCHEMDALASVMQQINAKYTISDVGLANTQILDGYSPALFYDYGNYVHNLCKDNDLLEIFDNQMKKTIIYTVCTPQLYSESKGLFNVNVSSGITISDPSKNQWATGKEKTSWYIKTH